MNKKRATLFIFSIIGFISIIIGIGVYYYMENDTKHKTTLDYKWFAVEAKIDELENRDNGKFLHSFDLSRKFGNTSAVFYLETWKLKTQDFWDTFKGRKNFTITTLRGYWTSESYWNRMYIQDWIEKPSPTPDKTTLYCKPQTIEKVISVPPLDVEWEVKVADVSVPFYSTTEGHILTFNSETYLKNNIEEKRLQIRTRTLKGWLNPNLASKMKARPEVYAKKGDRQVLTPDYVELVNNQITEIPVTIIVKEVKGKVEWK